MHAVKLIAIRNSAIRKSQYGITADVIIHGQPWGGVQSLTFLLLSLTVR